MSTRSLPESLKFGSLMQYVPNPMVFRKVAPLALPAMCSRPDPVETTSPGSAGLPPLQQICVMPLRLPTEQLG